MRISNTLSTCATFLGLFISAHGQNYGGNTNDSGGNKNDSGGKNGGGDRWTPDNGGGELSDKVQQVLVELVCAADETPTTCELRNEKEGDYVCRTLFNPVTGASRVNTICIPSDGAWARESDTCGCCNDECPPERPDFEEIVCTADTETVDTTTIQGDGDAPADVDFVVVCRQLANPWTGLFEPVTLRIPASRSLSDDECGCCDDICPDGDATRFERPDRVDLNCTVDDSDNYLPCEKGGDNVQGQFVCRESFHPVTGDLIGERALCIAPGNNAWETDSCGCCGVDCPVKPEREKGCDVEVETDVPTCTLRDDGEGIFVCRELFHPVDGALRQRSLCIPPERSFITDSCGCCAETGCPVIPEDGVFESEDAQLVSFALETSLDANADDGDDTSGGAYHRTTVFSAAAFGVVALAFF
jgi:hypothetical protein